MKVLLFIFLLSTQVFHEFKIGRYEIRPNDDSIVLFMKLDRYDFLEAVKNYSECSGPTVSELCMSDYILDHFKLNFDGADACIDYQAHTVKEEFIELTFRIGVSPSGINEIKVFNNVLLEQYPKQENIVFFMLNDKERSFRLNKDRINTVVLY